MIKIFPDNINPKSIAEVVKILGQDGVIITPTDTVYALACTLGSQKGLEKICSIKQIKTAQANFSIVFSDFSSLAEYTRPFSREVFRVMKSHLPGPYTFILNASSRIPDLFQSKKKTIGIRIPDHPILTALVVETGKPLVVASLHSDDEILDYYSDAEEIEAAYAHRTDMIIDGGYSEMTPSTVIDCTGDEPVIIREGKGKMD